MMRIHASHDFGHRPGTGNPRQLLVVKPDADHPAIYLLFMVDNRVIAYLHTSEYATIHRLSPVLFCNHRLRTGE